MQNKPRWEEKKERKGSWSGSWSGEIARTVKSCLWLKPKVKPRRGKSPQKSWIIHGETMRKWTKGNLARLDHVFKDTQVFHNPQGRI